MTKAKPPEGGGAKLRDQTPLDVGRSAELPGGAPRRRCVGGPERLETGSQPSIAITERETRVLESIRKRREDEDEGFTLIELMVVVLIIAILLAIAIPTFLGARERANDRAAQSSLRNALTAAKTIYTDTQNYTDATTASLSAVEPSLTFTTGDSTDFKVVKVSSNTTTFTAVAKSKSGKCFSIVDVATAGGGTTGPNEGASGCSA